MRTNVSNLSDAAMWKIRRARFARNRQKSVRSLRDSVKGGPPESKRAFSLPESLSNRLREWLTSVVFANIRRHQVVFHQLQLQIILHASSSQT